MYFLIALGFALSIGFQAAIYVFAPPRKDKELRRAFEALEEEFEEMRDHVRGALGRISRLKRSIMSGEVPNPEESPDSPTAALAGESGHQRWSTRATEINQKILARRNKGVQ